MILVVDDDPSVIASLTLLLEQSGYQSESAGSASQALVLAEQADCRLVIQDMNFSRDTSGEEGLNLVREIKQRRPDLPVVLLTAWGSIELAVEGMKAGAADFLTKPWNNAQVLSSIETVLAVEAARIRERVQPAPSRDELDQRWDFGGLLGEDPNLLRVLDLVGRISETDASVLITGESGTGKELVAEAIHRNSRRRDRAFVKVNLGGISSTLFESEMFGHVAGAFTDAKDRRRGRFEIADGGTIFLDEIGDVEPSGQVKLLRVLQDRSYEVLGSSRSRRVDVRVISATNRHLPEMVACGEFREDLLYRLNLIAIELPPLRQRAGDIPLLCSRFLEECSHTYGRNVAGISPRALDWLVQQPWPGNVRQLRQAIERAVLIGARDRLDLEDLQTQEPRRDPVADAPTGGLTLETMERKMIEASLERFDGNISRSAKELGLSRAALYRRCEKYGLKLERD